MQKVYAAEVLVVIQYSVLVASTGRTSIDIGVLKAETVMFPMDSNVILKV